MKTRDALGIIWQGEANVAGITVYGFWPRAGVPAPSYSGDGWPPNLEVKPHILVGESWSVWLWDLRIHVWPSTSEWVGVVSGTLEAICATGAIIAWCGVEGIFADPPALFNSSEMGGGVWAYHTREGRMHPPPNLDDDFKTVSDAELSQLHLDVIRA